VLAFQHHGFHRILIFEPKVMVKIQRHAQSGIDKSDFNSI